ncbi:GTP-binding protein OBG [Pycnococcus provasolii]
MVMRATSRLSAKLRRPSCTGARLPYNAHFAATRQTYATASPSTLAPDVYCMASSSSSSSSSKPRNQRKKTKARKSAPAPSPSPSNNYKKNKSRNDAEDKPDHLTFDSALVTVRSGDGGRGETAYYTCETPGTLSAPSGSNADVGLRLGLGKAGDQMLNVLSSAAAEPLRVGVPPGTVVRRKRTRRVLAELTEPWQEAVVLRGGDGGLGVTAPSRRKRGTPRRRGGEFDDEFDDDDGGYVVEEDDWKAASRGQPGEEARLELLLRVVADVGIVGLPSAGKSSLLAAITRAKPEVADYPFTTLIPNLGVMPPSFAPNASPAGGGTFARAGSEAWDAPMDVPAPVIADLPGLIEGAHVGRGLGRVFLRHLSRTRIVLHCVDVGSDPTAVAGSKGTGALDDYLAVRDELRMYNPQYVQRTHVIALTKMDLDGAAERADAFEQGLKEYMLANDTERDDSDDGTDAVELGKPAVAMVRVSAESGLGMEELSTILGKITAEAEAEAETREE